MCFKGAKEKELQASLAKYKCSDAKILDYLTVINPKSTAILEDEGKIGIFPLFLRW